MLTATFAIVALLAFIAGLAVQRHYRDDAACNTFADAVITLVVTPIAAVKAKFAAPPAEPKPGRSIRVKIGKTEPAFESVPPES